jgi:predicted transposase/invertase (TIGR01784 family)
MFDNLSKFLAQEYSRDFATWLIGKPVKLTELKPTELSLEPIRADSVILLKSRGLISHTEFQTDPDPEIPFREADYALRIHRKFPRHDLLQNVIYLRGCLKSLDKKLPKLYTVYETKNIMGQSYGSITKIISYRSH